MEASCGVCGAPHEDGAQHEYTYTEGTIIHNELMDAISKQPIVDGVELPCEHMFSRLVLQQWLATHRSCPVCRTHSTKNDLKPVPRSVRNMLDDLSVRML